MAKGKKLKITAFIVLGIIALVAGGIISNRNAASQDKSVEEQVERYRDLARYGEDVSILVDFGRSSSQQRFFVYDNRTRREIASSKCAHGCGGGSTAGKAVFSNQPGSECSSLGEYHLRCNGRLYNYKLPCIRLDGLSSTNSNAAARGIVIHECPVIGEAVTTGVPIPVSPYISQGCFSISTQTFKLLQDLVSHGKSIYLYANCE